MKMKILRVGYFWITIESDYGQFVQRCHKCHVHGDLIKVHLYELNALSSPWTFSFWGIDFIEPIDSVASNSHKFILVASNYFTKWVKVASYKAVT